MTTPVEPTTLVEVLRHHARQYPDKLAYAFLPNGEIGTEIGVSFAELEQQARTTAAHLLRVCEPGDRVLLLYPQGIDYVVGFLGCLYAGVIGVPIFPPRGKSVDMRIQVIADDAQAHVALTTEQVRVNLKGFDHATRLVDLQWIASDALDPGLADTWREPDIDSASLAFLQYTSGSTGTPKGVMVSHGNLLHNLAYMADLWDIDGDSTVVSWLPIFHDMGLIFGVLNSFYNGASCYLTTPAAFVQNPFRWLQIVSHYRGTHCAAPDFAYELCAEKVTAEQRAQLDLSHLQLAMNGAEPVRATTMHALYESFKECGLRERAIRQAYGLAESTLVIAGASRATESVLLHVDGAALERDRIEVVAAGAADARCFVGSGYVGADELLAIVNPHTLAQCAADEVGEIWFGSPSAAQGYWQRPEESAEIFAARLSDTGEGPFLRTGDLGFVHDNQLYIAGRLKDVIVIRGSNHYPQDIEFSVERSHPALRPAGHGAAFSIEHDGEEKLVVMQEVERSHIRRLRADEIFAAISQRVSEEHELQIHAVVLLKTATIPRTSSGKIQRSTCRAAYLAGELAAVATWQQEAPATPSGAAAHNAMSAEDVRAWLLAHLAERFQVARIDAREPLARYGLDSLTAVRLSGELESLLDRSLSPTLLYDYPSVDALVSYLSGGSSRALEVRARTEAADEPIAIVGMGCRFPSAASPREFLQLLREGRDAVGHLPAARTADDLFHAAHADAPSLAGAHRGGFLDQVASFDAPFFGLTPREAELMDPQQRLLLEVCWEALEDAGIAADGLRGSATGVFVGISTGDYSALQMHSGRMPDGYLGTGNSFSIAANRLSYVLDLRGPSMAIDTACSSSLSALHQACLNLRRGECELALTAGVNLILSSHFTSALAQAGMLSPDGQCKTFDAAANGYVRGEGCGAVVLKRLSAAERDGDRVLAVVRGVAVNQDGRSNGLTAPNSLAQQAVVRQALHDAGVGPQQIGYLEAHGTGTELGDPIEIGALKEVLLPDRPAEQHCWIGSVKTNIGHLEAAAGMAGLLKAVLSLHHGEIFPHLHLRQINPLIDIADTPLAIPTELQPWPEDERFAGVSSFGFGGTNTHAVLSAAPAPTKASNGQTQHGAAGIHLLTLSATDERALRALAQRYADYLHEHPEVDLADICVTAGTGRAHLAQRLAAIAASADELRTALAAFAHEGTAKQIASGTARDAPRPKNAFLFTGQGAQYNGMGRRLYETQPLFRGDLDECAAILRDELEQPLLEVLWDPAMGDLLNQTAYTQPALFALEYALARQWQRWGIEPAAVMGHSVGEYAAACIAGVFSLQDGLRLIAARGRLMGRLPQDGAMVSVRCAEAHVAEALESHAATVAIAAVNGPNSTVISGERGAIAALTGQFESEGKETTALNVSHAFHSPLMDSILAPFAEIAERVTFAQPKIDFIANLSGERSDQVATAAYWVEHIRRPVRFAQGMQTLAQMGCGQYVEIGPMPVLLGMGRSSQPESDALWLPSLRQGEDEEQQMLRSLGALYLRGEALDWQGLTAKRAPQRLALPTYPFQRQRHWFPAPAVSHRAAGALHPLWAERWQSPLLDTEVFTTPFSVSAPSFLRDHVVYDTLVVAGASHISMLLTVAELLWDTGRYVLEDIAFLQALALTDGQTRTVQALFDAGEGRVRLISFAADAHGDYIEHVNACLRTGGDPPTPQDLGALRARCEQSAPAALIYDAMEARAFRLGSSFRWIDSIGRDRDEILCRMKMPQQVADADHFTLHPGLIDSCFQPVFLSLQAGDDSTLVPFRLQRFSYYGHPRNAQELWCYATISHSDDGVLLEMQLLDEGGRILAAAEGLQARRAQRSALLHSLQRDSRDWLCEVAWEELAAPPATAPMQGPWLVLADTGGLGTQLAESLRAKGEECIVIERDSAFAHLDTGHYALDPQQPEQWRALLSALVGGNGAVQPYASVVHLWGLDADLATLGDAGQALDVSVSSCNELLQFLQSLDDANVGDGLGLVLVTRGAQHLPDDKGVVQAQQRALWGLGHTIAQEYAPCTLVDLDPDNGDGDGAVLMELLTAGRSDSGSVAGGEERIAYRRGRAHAARLQRTRPSDVESPDIRANAAYVITGGLGGLGLEVGQWLAARGAGQLLLVGRRVAGTDAQREIETMESAGAQVRVIQADITCADDVERIVAAAQSEYPLRGIVHAAGVLADGLLRNQSAEQLQSALAPKVSGTWNLHEQTRASELDFFVCFSSSTALMGAAGQGNYAAANAFMDALMQERRRDGLPGLSINWGPWNEVGMAAALEPRERERLAEQGWLGLAPTQGLALLERLLGTDTAQLAALPIDWTGFYPRVADDPFFAAFAPTEPQKKSADDSAALRTELASLPEARQRDALTKHVRGRIAAVARLDGNAIGPRQRFFDMGLDSLMAVELRNSLQQATGVALPATVAFDYPTLEALVDYLGQQLFAGDRNEDQTPEPVAVQRVEQTEASALEALDADGIAALLDKKLDELNL